MRHMFTQFAAAAALTALSIATAFAHAGLEHAEAVPGGYKAVIKIPHGCDGKPTDTVRIDVPEGYVGVKPMPKPGWTLAVEKGDYARTYDLHGSPVSSGVKSVTWNSGSLADEHFDEFVLSGTLAGVEEGQTLSFRTVQKCGADQIAWDEEPAAGQSAHDLEHPAPRLTVLAAQGGHDHHGASAASEVVKAGDLEIASAWARAMLPGQPAGGGYLSIANKGTEPDRLVAASSPAAGKVEIHTMQVVNDVMVMRPVEGALEIPAGAMVELKPGGLHLMFMTVATPFAEGSAVPVTLTFEKAGAVELSLPVTAKGGAEDHSKH